MALALADSFGRLWQVKADTDGTVVTDDDLSTLDPTFADDFDGAPAYELWETATGVLAPGVGVAGSDGYKTVAGAAFGAYDIDTSVQIEDHAAFTRNLVKRIAPTRTVRVAFKLLVPEIGGLVYGADASSPAEMTDGSWSTGESLYSDGTREHYHWGMVSFWTNGGLDCVASIDHIGYYGVANDPSDAYYVNHLSFRERTYGDGPGGNGGDWGETVTPDVWHDVEIIIRMGDGLFDVANGRSWIIIRVDGEDTLNSLDGLFSGMFNQIGVEMIDAVKFGPPAGIDNFYDPDTTAQPYYLRDDITITEFGGDRGITLLDDDDIAWLLTVGTDGGLVTTDVYDTTLYPAAPSQRYPLGSIGGTHYVLMIATDGVITTESYSDGDYFADPLVATLGTATSVVDLTALTLEPGEPATTETATAWMRFQTRASRPGRVAIESDGGLVELYEGTSLDDLVLVDSTTGALTEVLFSQTLYARISGAATVELTYTFEERVPPLVVTVLEDLEVAPGLVPLTVSNMTPGVLVHFSIAEEPTLTDYFQVNADSTGSLAGFNLPISIELPAGPYTVSVFTDDGSVGDDTVIIQRSPDVRPDPPMPDTLPANPNNPGRWTVIDPASGETWVFPYSPSSITTPHAPKVYDFETTTAPNGQVLTWEGAADPVPWELTGYLDTQAFYEALEGYVDTNRRFIIVDHRDRGWVVLFEGFDPSYRKSVGNDWSFDYTLQVLIIAGVTL